VIASRRRPVLFVTDDGFVRELPLRMLGCFVIGGVIGFPAGLFIGWWWAQQT
jgi:hypothetical protein